MILKGIEINSISGKSNLRENNQLLAGLSIIHYLRCLKSNYTNTKTTNH